MTEDSSRWRVLTTETMPEWAKGNEGMEQLLDTLAFNLSVENKLKVEGKPHYPDIPSLPPKVVENCPTQAHEALEIICGCIVAYMSAMSESMPNQLFGQICAPLAEVISQSLHQIGVIHPIDPVKTQALIDEAQARAEQREERTKKAAVKALGTATDEFDKPSALDKAIEALKGLGKTSVH